MVSDGPPRHHSFPLDTRAAAQVRGERVESPFPHFKARWPSVGRCPNPRRVPGEVEPAWPGWKPGTSAARPRAPPGGREGAEPSRPLQADTLGKRRPRLGRRNQRLHVASEAESSTACDAASVAGTDLEGWSGLPFRRAAAGIEPASGRLTAAYPYQHGTHRITSVRTAGFEPAISCARSTRNTRLSYVLISGRPAGVEPARPPRQGDRLPLTPQSRANRAGAVAIGPRAPTEGWSCVLQAPFKWTRSESNRHPWLFRPAPGPHQLPTQPKKALGRLSRRALDGTSGTWPSVTTAGDRTGHSGQRARRSLSRCVPGPNSAVGAS